MGEIEKREVWEVQIAGTVWVQVYEPATKTFRPVPLNKKGTRRIQLTAAEREHSQSLIDYDKPDRDPFKNGNLALIVDGRPVGVVTDDDLIARLEFRDTAAFEEAIEDIIPNELLLRRLKDLARERGTVAQYERVRELIDEHYKVGGTQRTVREMIAAGEKLTGTVLH